MQGVFDAEGNVNIEYYRIIAYNTDLEVVEFFKTILDTVGIAAKIHEVRQKESLKKHTTGKTYRRKSEKIYHIVISGKENILKFAEEIGFTIARKKQNLNKLLSKYKNY